MSESEDQKISMKVHWPEYLLILEYMLNNRKPESKTFTFYQIIYGETSAITAKKRQKEIQIRKKIQKDAEKRSTGFPASEYKTND